MRIYLGEEKPEDIIGLENYPELHEDYIKDIKAGKMGFVDLGEDGDMEDDDIYYHPFVLVENKDENFKLTERQKNILVVATDYICDATLSLAKANGFEDFTGYGFTDSVDDGRDTVLYICGNSENGKELIYKYDA